MLSIPWPGGGVDGLKKRFLTLLSSDIFNKKSSETSFVVNLYIFSLFASLYFL